MKWLVWIGSAVLVVAVLGYLGVIGYFFVRQRDFQYDRGGRMFDLSETTLSKAELVKIPSADGSVLAGWYQPPADGNHPVILYYRGKTESFSREYARYEQFVADGYGFLAFDYRGFGGSPGELTEPHVLADGLAAFDWLKPKGFHIVIWGRSLGSGPATYVASQRQADALYLESPFTSAEAVAQRIYPYLPVGLIMLDQYHVDRWMPKVDEPVFVAHGELDPAIPVDMARTVYALAPDPVGLWIDPAGDHDNLWDHGEWEKAKAFFAGVESGIVAAAATPANPG